ncbi:MAG: N-acetyl-gamma-glutamyl-phosphate reductase [Gammaproteobacteria bacterium]|nr:N-acetyl-gamma-glutamyl-phosphate reductase [Gammaproteobacteria bacterium]MDH4312047.1 N-acetyl-gamma-glutamyl-phosphate reductase [Gammaproteobacteria bacterium]MDH5273002.1 N-acetyl-gamma-glutamyl-phosphate reductase [Gammaproteobacteria bacterium]
MSARTPAIVLGGTGYVAGELLRLLASHPYFDLAAVASDSQPDEPVARFFRHLQPVLPHLRFANHEEIVEYVTANPTTAVFSAAPHGVSAALIDRLLTAAEQAETQARVVDISADFRYSSADAYQSVYKHAHGAPDRLGEFTCAVPEHLNALPTSHVAHPGCFATAVLLASVPLLSLDLIEPRLFVSGVTGSTGSGRQPVAGTHHPQRHGDLYSYNALAHRHTPEITALALAASGTQADFAFVPHSGPFARGIHVTVQAALRESMSTHELVHALREYYDQSVFVRVSGEMPRLKDVVASNFAELSAVSNGRTVAVMCAIDNLTKGAAGGAVQWMNRMFGHEETAGLMTPAPGWT